MSDIKKEVRELMFHAAFCGTKWECGITGEKFEMPKITVKDTISNLVSLLLIQVMGATHGMEVIQFAQSDRLKMR